jgi:hypothetical protein
MKPLPATPQSTVEQPDCAREARTNDCQRRLLSFGSKKIRKFAKVDFLTKINPTGS